jgi:hypothetical protein
VRITDAPRSRRRPRRLLAPEQLDQTLDGHDLVRAQEQQREQRALALAGDLDGGVVTPDLERAEQAKVEHVAVVTPVANPSKRG